MKEGTDRKGGTVAQVNARTYFYSIFGGPGEPFVPAPPKVIIGGAGIGDTTSQPDEYEVGVAMEFLRLCRVVKGPTINSYSLKHVIERWAATRSDCRYGRGTRDYISNGAAIEAARRLGIPFFVHERDPKYPNAEICISKISLRELNHYGVR
jgi:hypothetical protein